MLGPHRAGSQPSGYYSPAGGSPRTGVLGGQKVSRTCVLGPHRAGSQPSGYYSPAGGSPRTGVLGGQKVSRTSVLGPHRAVPQPSGYYSLSSRWQSSYRGAGWSKGKQDPCVRYLTELDHNPVVITVCPAGGSPCTGVLGGQKVSRTSVLGTSQSWITTQWLLQSVQQVAVFVQGCWVVKR